MSLVREYKIRTFIKVLQQRRTAILTILLKTRNSYTDQTRSTHGEIRNENLMRVFFYVLLTVHLSIVLDKDQLDLFYNTFIIILYMFRVSYAHHQEFELYWCRIWYRHSQSVAVRCTGWERTGSHFPLNLAPDGHLLRVMISEAASIQFKLLMMSIWYSKHVKDYNKRIVK